MAAFWLLSGCSAPEAREIVRPLTLHALTSCPIPTPAQLDLSALGDFPTSNDTTPSLSLSAQNVELGIPSQTLALQATAQPEGSDQSFIGYSERGPTGLDFLLWPRASACELQRASGYPAGLGGEALGFASETGLLMLAGSEGFSSSAVVGALTFDARSGRTVVVDPRSTMRRPRAFATVTGFAAQLLVAGGESPIHESGSPANVLNDTAEVYDPITASFEPDFVPLALGVTRHAAIALESGETALIGGRTEASAASSFVQVVSPVTRTAKLLGTLSAARVAPSVLRLSDGRLLVAGGEDETGQPVASLEWRAADAGPLPFPFEGSIALPPRFDRAFAALPGGAVLAVGGCEDRPARAGEDCARECRRGCPPAPSGKSSERYDAFWISAEGRVTQLDFPYAAGCPSLLPGTDGRPWLIAEDASPGADSLALYRFDPWQGQFEPTGNTLGLSVAPSPPRFIAMGLDSFAWLMEDAQGIVLNGVRLGTRSAFSNDVALVTPRDAEHPTEPAHLAPDHAPSGDLSFEGGPGALAFAAHVAGANPSCVWLSDAWFADFSAEIAFSSAVSPSLRLGGTALLAAEAEEPSASGACRLPAFAANPDGGRLQLERSGTHLAAKLGGASSECTIGSERVPIGVCQSELGAVRVTRVSVTRRR